MVRRCLVFIFRGWRIAMCVRIPHLRGCATIKPAWAFLRPVVESFGWHMTGPGIPCHGPHFRKPPLIPDGRISRDFPNLILYTKKNGSNVTLGDRPPLSACPYPTMAALAVRTGALFIAQVLLSRLAIELGRTPRAAPPGAPAKHSRNRGLSAVI